MTEYKLVPVEPTEEMCMAAMKTLTYENKGIEFGPYIAYKAMLSAAPEPASCEANTLSSRMCELGTKGCNIEHGAAPLPKDELRDDATAVFPRPCGCGDQGDDLLTEILKVTPEHTPLPDDVAAMVERLRTGGETYEELLDLCARQAADMLERLARELAAKQDEINFMSECVKTACEDRKYFEERAAERNKLSNDLQASQRELAAVKAENEEHLANLYAASGEIMSLRAENEKLREDAERYRFLRNSPIDETYPEGWYVIQVKSDGGKEIAPARNFTSLDSAIDSAMKGEK